MGARKLERVPCRGGRGFSGRESRVVAHLIMAILRVKCLARWGTGTQKEKGVNGGGQPKQRTN